MNLLGLAVLDPPHCDHAALHSTADRAATGPVGNQSDTAAQGQHNSWALGPICQGGNQNNVVVLLVVQLVAQASLLVVLGRMAQGA